MNKRVNYKAREFAERIKTSSVSGAEEVIALKNCLRGRGRSGCRSAQRLHLARACHISSCTDDMPITS